MADSLADKKSRFVTKLNTVIAEKRDIVQDRVRQRVYEKLRLEEFNRKV